jgi:hypothetical protein
VNNQHFAVVENQHFAVVENQQFIPKMIEEQSKIKKQIKTFLNNPK